MSELLGQNIKPGTFRLEESVISLTPSKQVEPELYRPPILVKKVFPKFINRFGEHTWVYYPCSGGNVSPSLFFREVLYLDKDKKVVSVLNKAGFKAYSADVTLFDPQRRTDLLILFNPHLNKNETKSLLTKVRPKLILCNNYHNTADHIRKIPTLDFLGNIEKLYSVFRTSN